MPGLKPKELLELLKQTFTEFGEDKAPRLGAALSYYTIFSMAPLLVVIMGVIGIFYSDSEHLLEQQLKQMLTPQAAEAVHDMLKSATQNKTGGIMATIIGTATLLLGAGGFFGQMQDALNTIWEVKPKAGQGFMAMLKNRFLSFTMVLGTGFILLVSLFINTLISSMGDYMLTNWGMPEFLMQIINLVVSFAVVTLLFAMIFKVLPDVEISWRDVWIGAAVTALLFAIGKLGLGLYLGKSTVGSAYGAAGSLAVLLLWIYYAAQILFFGAEFTQVYAKKYGSKILPSPHAEAVTAAERAQEGITSGSKGANKGTTGGDMPEGMSVPLHPHGLPIAAATASPAQLNKQRDKDFLLTATIGFLSMFFFKNRRRQRHS